MSQQTPFPANGRTGVYNKSLLSEGGLRVEDFELTNILGAYNRRQGEKIMDHYY